MESKSGSRVQKQIGVYHLKELASVELAKEWPKRKVLQDLVPDNRKLYILVLGYRPSAKKYYTNRSQISKSIIAFSVLTRVVRLSTVVHLVLKLTWALVHWERLWLENTSVFSIRKNLSQRVVLGITLTVHSEDWFVVNPTTTESFEKLVKIKQHQQEEEKRRR